MALIFAPLHPRIVDALKDSPDGVRCREGCGAVMTASVDGVTCPACGHIRDFVSSQALPDGLFDELWDQIEWNEILAITPDGVAAAKAAACA